MDREDLEELHAIKKIVKRPRVQSLIEKLEQPDSSRYITDYDHKGTLGEGGFGTVLHAQHKLDKKCYAIKLIKIIGKDASSPRIAVREVEIMSSLYHINVVMYHQAWYDSFQDNMYGVGDEREMDEFYALMESGLKGTTEVNDDDDDGSHSASLKSEDVKQRSEESIGGEDDGSYNASVKSEDTKETEESIDGEDDGSYNASVKSEDSKKRSEESIDGEDAKCEHNFVCIQMQLCDRTLHDVLELNVYQYNREKAINIFRQIVEGVSYMHEKGIAHNDLNPKNIFFVADTVKIGDFGLATFLNGGSDKEADSSGSITGVPTYYIAPEGRPANEKVDIYSLGVILFELYHPFGTGGERDVELRALKGGTPYSNVAAKFPKASSLVKQLMALDPTDRPSAKDLLELHIDTLLED